MWTCVYPEFLLVEPAAHVLVPAPATEKCKLSLPMNRNDADCATFCRWSSNFGKREIPEAKAPSAPSASWLAGSFVMVTAPTIHNAGPARLLCRWGTSLVARG